MRLEPFGARAARVFGPRAVYARRMRAGWIALSCAAACGPAPPAAIPAATPPPAAADEDAPAPPLPDGEYVFRTFSTGAIVARHQLATYRLRRTGTRATLTIEKQTAQARGMPGEITLWPPPAAPVSYSGTAVQRGALLELSLARDTASLRLHCRRVQEPVAAADAARTPSDVAGTEGCGDEGTWSPPALTPVDALACMDAGEPGRPSHDTDGRLVFAAPPGIEWLYVNDDCAMQGGGLRRIPADGATARFRAGDL